MLDVYLKPILSACYIFPFLAAIVTLPYVVYQYRKYGALLLLRIGIVYTFIFYMMTSYFMTILPLPDISSVTPSTATVLLVPFAALRRWYSVSGLVLSDPSTYLLALTDTNFLQILFNILLLFPFGVYLRYYFNRTWYQTLILSFCYSLFFELTQLSGLYGIYPYPYRFFEVDDLICNTLGGMLGFLVTPALLFFLPARQKLDVLSYQKGTHVSFFRRLFALMIDLILFAVSVTFLYYKTPVSTYLTNFPTVLILPVALFCYFSIFALLTRGATIGKKIVKIKLISQKGGHAGAVFLIFRYALIYLCIVPTLAYAFSLISLLSQVSGFQKQLTLMFVCALLIIATLLFALHILVCFVRRQSCFVYDRILHLILISTITIPDNAVKTPEVNSSVSEAEQQAAATHEKQ